MKYQLTERNYAIPDQELIDDMMAVAKRLDKKILTADVYQRHGKYCSSTIKKRFSTWLAALERAGLQPHRLPMETKIADPSCGTGGFFLGALSYLNSNYRKLTKEQENFLRFKTFHGWEIVPATARLCLMNLFLHGIGDLKDTPEIEVTDSLKTAPKEKVDIVFANPPFGKTSSDKSTNDEKKADQLGFNFRKDFWDTTGNKQIAFVQHIYTMLKSTGVAAIVVPDNILFEGGAGETIRKNLLKSTNLHTILRLPTGIFYAQGVKANVIFLENKPIANKNWTQEIWIYDYRTNVHHTPKKSTLKIEDLKDFITCYNPVNQKKRKETWSERNPEGRWRKFLIDEIINRDKTSLDITWIKDNSLANLDNLPTPDVLVEEIIEDLEAGLKSFKQIIVALNKKIVPTDAKT